MPLAAIDALLDEVGQLEDPELEHEAYRRELGAVSLVLRRDCHGALRRLEAEFSPARRDALVAHLAPLVGRWLTIVPRTFDLADVPALGRLSLLAGRLDVAVRLEPRRELLRELLERVTAPLPDDQRPPAEARVEARVEKDPRPC